MQPIPTSGAPVGNRLMRGVYREKVPRVPGAGNGSPVKRPRSIQAPNALAQQVGGTINLPLWASVREPAVGYHARNVGGFQCASLMNPATSRHRRPGVPDEPAASPH
jgi:hypothetical protein